jgi:hypothetical protein
MSDCQRCAQHRRKVPATEGRLCADCSTQLRKKLHGLVDLAAQARLALEPSRSRSDSRTPTFESRPPLNVDAVDPERALIELSRGDRSSAVPIVEALEMWEVRVRQDRELTPYGPASLERQGPVLTCVVGFLGSHVSWMTETAEFPLLDFYDHVVRASAVLARWDWSREGSQWGLRCPNEREGGSVCGSWIRWEPGARSAVCLRCGREWDIPWLVRVAGDVWLDSDSIAHLTGVPRRTIQHWAKSGKVERRGMLYRLGDVMAVSRDRLAVGGGHGSGAASTG